MFRSLISLIRVRSEATEHFPDGDQPSEGNAVGLASDSVQGGDAAYPSTLSSMVHVVQIDCLPAAESREDSTQVATDCSNLVNFGQNSHCINVDFGVQNVDESDGGREMPVENIALEQGGMTEKRVMEGDGEWVGINVLTQQREGSANVQMLSGIQQFGVSSSFPVNCYQSNKEGCWKTQETGHAQCTVGSIPRSSSTFSTDSLAECCRICQQSSEEPLMELGCQCRGELSKAHHSCIEQWFNNKGSNQCEICQHEATNLPSPVSGPMQNFWVWRISGTNRVPNAFTRRQGGARFHPLWAALLILIAGLLFDALISISLGSSAVPINLIIGVLAILGVGTVSRLIAECWRGHNRRNMQRMEMASNH
eukprot:c26223_g1_i1 orf=538-1635(-)